MLNAEYIPHMFLGLSFIAYIRISGMAAICAPAMLIIFKSIGHENLNNASIAIAKWPTSFKHRKDFFSITAKRIVSCLDASKKLSILLKCLFMPALILYTIIYFLFTKRICSMISDCISIGTGSEWIDYFSATAFYLGIIVLIVLLIYAIIIFVLTTLLTHTSHLLVWLTSHPKVDLAVIPMSLLMLLFGIILVILA